MLLCDIAPNDVYRWFMELFIDSYDWVMVPNVYGMSQHADGGLMTTKPYVSGSSYVLNARVRSPAWLEALATLRSYTDASAFPFVARISDAGLRASGS